MTSPYGGAAEYYTRGRLPYPRALPGLLADAVGIPAGLDCWTSDAVRAG